MISQLFLCCLVHTWADWKGNEIKYLHCQFLGKIAGAVGIYNSEMAAFSNVNWQTAAEDFVTSLGLTFDPYTTEIEPHDYTAEHYDTVTFYNISLGFDHDVWSCFSLGYFNQSSPVKLALPRCLTK